MDLLTKKTNRVTPALSFKGGEAGGALVLCNSDQEKGVQLEYTTHTHVHATQNSLQDLILNILCAK